MAKHNTTMGPASSSCSVDIRRRFK